MKKKIAVIISIVIIFCLSLCVVLNVNSKNRLVNITEKNGLSAYELAVTNGYDGTVTEWIDSISSKSSFEIAKENGYSGDDSNWLDSLEEKFKSETVGIKFAEISSYGNLIITLTDNTEINLGKTSGLNRSAIINTVSVSDSNELIITMDDSKKYNLGIIKGNNEPVSSKKDESITNIEVKNDGLLDISFSDGNKSNLDNSKTSAPSIYVESVTAHPGDTVEVPVSIFNNPGINGAQFDVAYNSKLKLNKAQNGNALSSLNFTASKTYLNPCKFLWDGLNEDEKGNGIALILSFSVPSEANVGEEYYVSISYPEGAIYDSNLNNVDFNTINGVITIL